jgi:ATP-binding cassette subfamily F protein uup
LLLQKLGKDMADLEAQLKRGSDRLNALNSSGAAWADIEALSLELAGLQAAYDAKEERWFELAEIAGDL